MAYASCIVNDSVDIVVTNYCFIPNGFQALTCHSISTIEMCHYIAEKNLFIEFSNSRQVNILIKKYFLCVHLLFFTKLFIIRQVQNIKGNSLQKYTNHDL